MDINALLKKYEDELNYQSQVNEYISTQTASALMRLAVKEVAANTDEGWKEAAKNADRIDELNFLNRKLRERIKDIGDDPSWDVRRAPDASGGLLIRREGKPGNILIREIGEGRTLSVAILTECMGYTEESVVVPWERLRGRG